MTPDTSGDNSAQVLLRLANEFLMPLRLGHGFDRASFDALCAGTREVNALYKISSTHPKSVVSVLIYINPGMYSCERLYRGEEHDELVAASVELLDVILKGLEPE